MTLTTYQKFQQIHVLSKSVMSKMLHGVSTRDYRAASEAVKDATVLRNRVSAGNMFGRELMNALKEFNERSIEKYFPVIFIDGYEIGGGTIVVARGIDENGVKMALSMPQGGTENVNIVKSLFDDMEGRGLQKERPILFVIDG